MRSYTQKPHLLRAGIFVLFTVLSACDFAMPRRVEVNTELRLSVPIGDIGKVPEVQELLESTRPEKIAELFDETEAYVYHYYAEKEYEGNENSGYAIPLPDGTDKNKNAEAPYDSLNALRSDEVRTLLVRFPLTGVNLDFTEYLKTEVETPDVTLPDVGTLFPMLPPGANIPSYELPPIDIPLGVMSEWIEYIILNAVNGEKTTVALKDGAELAGTLKLAIPAFGIGNDERDYQEGEVRGNDLVFKATVFNKELDPKTDTVKVCLSLEKVPPRNSRNSYPVNIDLKWTEAKVKPGDQGNYDGKVRLPLGQMDDIFTKYRLVTLPYYLYVGGPFSEQNEAEIGLKIGNDWIVGNSGQGETIDHSYDFRELYQPLAEGKTTYYNGPLSYASTASFNLAEKLNQNNSTDLFIDYWISVQDSWIVTSDKENGVITADLIVLLPLEMEVLESAKTPLVSIEQQKYICMMEMADYGLNGDLFRRDRTEGSKNRIMGVSISGTTLKNTIYAGKLFLRIHDGSSFDELHPIDLNEDKFSIDIAGDRIPMPFHPIFGVYMEKPDGKNTIVRIKPKKDKGDDEFSMQISVDVAGEMTYEQDL
jgi:hypothetical protein